MVAWMMSRISAVVSAWVRSAIVFFGRLLLVLVEDDDVLDMYNGDDRTW